MSTDLAFDIVPNAPEYVKQCETLFIAIFDAGESPETCQECLLAEHYLQHIQRFGEGQFVALERVSRRVVGSATSMRITHDPAHPHLARWWQSIGEGTLSTHEPNGEWLYGVESCVDPLYRRRGIGGGLMRARMDLVRRLNLRGIIAGSMPRDYFRVEMPIESYVEAVVRGEFHDTNLSMQVHMGFQPVQIIPNYVIDLEPRGYGVLIVWNNPDYRSPSE